MKKILVLLISSTLAFASKQAQPHEGGFHGQFKHPQLNKVDSRPSIMKQQ